MRVSSKSGITGVVTSFGVINVTNPPDTDVPHPEDNNGTEDSRGPSPTNSEDNCTVISEFNVDVTSGGNATEDCRPANGATISEVDDTVPAGANCRAMISANNGSINGAIKATSSGANSGSTNGANSRAVDAINNGAMSEAINATNHVAGPDRLNSRVIDNPSSPSVNSISSGIEIGANRLSFVGSGFGVLPLPNRSGVVSASNDKTVANPTVGDNRLAVLSGARSGVYDNSTNGAMAVGVTNGVVTGTNEFNNGPMTITTTGVTQGENVANKTPTPSLEAAATTMQPYVRIETDVADIKYVRTNKSVPPPTETDADDCTETEDEIDIKDELIDDLENENVSREDPLIMGTTIRKKSLYLIDFDNAVQLEMNEEVGRNDPLS